MKIKSISARQILDSRGNPTIEADVVLENGILGRAIVPSGASTGTHEALELRDGDPKTYGGLGVLKAVENVKTKIAQTVSGKDIEDQKNIDQTMITLDGTENKSNLGANAILAVSLSCAKAAALYTQVPLHKYVQTISGTQNILLPVPQMNIINGGRHAQGSTNIQEFMIMPIGASSFSKALQMGSEVFHALAVVLKNIGYQTTVGDEGGYAPSVTSNKEAIELIIKAVGNAGYQIGKDIVLALDVAASELFDNGHYTLQKENKTLVTSEMTDWLESLAFTYPIASIEDGLDQEDWSGWKLLTEKLGNKIQIVGDDLFVTNTKFLEKGIQEKAANAILVKVNQIGTLSETIDAVNVAKKAGWNAIISHRSGETEDTTISHLAVGLGCGQIKTGSLSRSERIAKYNELLRIEENLGESAVFAGKNVLKGFI